MQHFNTIIIGAGHNGLICAAYLARSGQRVLVLEAGDTAGGLAATRTFHPGYMVSVAHSVSQFPGKIARDLDLTAHGYQPGNAIATTAEIFYKRDRRRGHARPYGHPGRHKTKGILFL